MASSEQPTSAGTTAEAGKSKAAAAVAAAQAAQAAKSEKEVTRREFNWLALAWAAFTAASVAGLTATFRFMFPNVLFEPPTLFKAGLPSDYKPGEVDERFKEKYGVWIIRGEDNIMYALIAICTHLGCPPNWLPAEQKFKCPCHGSGYYKSGINFEGPTPRPLERAKITIGEDGEIIVDKGRKYQWEKGEWTDPESFLKI